ncbi:glycosyltransferase WbuB [Bacteroidia bacterium]|nr:glycosyltransferase WbuB [Bacteroidia bacterium]
MKKLLLYTNFYYPEVVSIGQIITELSEGLSEYFHVTVICAVPCYITGKIENKYKDKRFYYEKYKGIDVIRVRVTEYPKASKINRIKYIISYFINSILVTFKVGKQDIVFTTSQPPILGGLLGVIGKWITKGKLVYQIMDFNPEQTIAAGYSGNKLLLKAMLYLDNYSCRKSDRVVLIGDDMRETLTKRFANKELPKNVVINNWIDEEAIYPLEKTHHRIIEFKECYGLLDKFIIMVSGNIGLYYDYENILKVMEGFKHDTSVAFVFVGDGAVTQKLVDYTIEYQVLNATFIPYQDKKDLLYSLNVADVHIVTNAKGIKGVSVPSKIYGVLATNIPVWGILEKGSEAWNIIEKSGCGILAEAGDYETIKNTLAYIIKKKDKFVQTHLTGRQFLLEYFTKQKSIELYHNLLEDIL